GGRFAVTLTSGISKDICTDTAVFIIDLPDLTVTYDTVRYNVCLGTSFAMPDGTLKWQTGKYPYTYTSQYHCDSIVVFDVTFRDRPNVTVSDTVCSNEIPYLFNGQSITETGVYTAQGTSIYGCDSVTTLRLTVLDNLEVEINDSAATVCPDETSILIPYQIRKGVATGKEIIFGQKAQDAGFTANTVGDNIIVINLPYPVRPDNYTATVRFLNSDCGNLELPIAFTVLYPNNVITQRWNDILAVRNSLFNGGYDFVSFQWYRNGTAIQGATSWYIYTPEGLDNNAAYAVNLVRQGETAAIMTCGFIPTEIQSDLFFVTNNSKQITVQTSHSAHATLYNVMGLPIGDYELIEGQNTINVLNSGMYILIIKLENGNEKTFKLAM
ncbi:MAG: hypothetical protein LBN23_00980, partial [Paludibacter sp.]|nr:hypothetical protein [Paludibacter sp.]